MSESQAAATRELASIADLFRQTKALEVKVVAFMNEMENDLPGPHKGIRLHDQSTEFLHFLERNRERYGDELEPELVKLTITLRTRHGIMPLGLTDGAILNDSILPQTVEPIRKGLSEAGNRLFDMMTSKASEP